MKTMQPVLPPARTEYEAWTRWLNRMQTKLLKLSNPAKTVIKVVYYEF